MRKQLISFAQVISSVKYQAQGGFNPNPPLEYALAWSTPSLCKHKCFSAQQTLVTRSMDVTRCDVVFGAQGFIAAFIT